MRVLELNEEDLKEVMDRLDKVFNDAKRVYLVLRDAGINEKEIYNFIIAYVSIVIGADWEAYYRLLRDIENLYWMQSFGWVKDEDLE
jgi:hypothetical protein